MRADDGRVIPNFCSQALQGDDLTIYGDGSQAQSFCYVLDLIDDLRALMTTEGLADEVVNVGNDNETTVRRLAEVVANLADTESGVTNGPLPKDDPERRQPGL